MRRRALLAPLTLAAVLAPAASTSSHPGHGYIAVSIKNLAYNPGDVQAVQNDTVIWFWDGQDRNHSVTSDPGQAETFDSDPSAPPSQGTHSPSQGYSHMFTQIGTFTYHCQIHPAMHGKVTVGPQAGGPPPEDVTEPVLSRVTARPAKFCTRHSRRCAKRGTVLVFGLSEKSDVLVEVRRRRGSKAFGKVVVAIDPRGKVGENRVALAGAKLRPGAYSIKIVATDAAGNSSKARTVAATVRK